ncbi:L-histidine N(alpha)-methyltransferase [Methyloligella sp. GL2]|nr:L-histidine N(alpha)-methyltransferase [Methyloligella sp. GL2]
MAAAASLDAAALPEEQAEFAEAVLAGLSAPRKAIPSRFLYDARGSELFEEITGLEEYYPTRTEIGLLERYAGEMAEAAGPAKTLVEFGSGSSRKTRLLIDALDGLETYVPLDIEESCLAQAKAALEADYVSLEILPQVADFTKPVKLPEAASGARLGFFSGSTIGNLDQREARRFLTNAGRSLGPGAGFLIGADLRKRPETLIRAYNDSRGVTAEFNLNLLARINRELGGDFDVSAFRHEAIYDGRFGRVEMHLISLEDQTVTLLGQRLRFREGETIHTENSHKYSLPEFRLLATDSGWRHEALWVDDDALFSLHLLRLPG